MSSGFSPKVLFNLAIEFGPIVTFIVLAELIDFITATEVFVYLTIIALIAAYIDRKKFAPFPVIVSLVVILAGFITVVYDNPEFFIIETSLYNASCAIAVLISLYLKKPILKKLFSDTFSITDKGWTILTKRWGYMFVLLALSNEIVRLNFSPDQWVRYKFIATIITAAFGFYQLKLTKTYRQEDATKWGMRP